MGKLIPINEIGEEFDDFPFLDAPEGYWNVSKEGYNGFEQIAIEDMTEKHKQNCIKMINDRYIPRYKNQKDILELFEQKIRELENC